MSTAVDHAAASRGMPDTAPAATMAERLLAGIRNLAPDITARAAEIEARREIPPDLLQALKSAGVFRLLVARSHGGMELDLPTALEIIAALARIDGSVGWCAMTGAGGALFAGLLPRESYDQVYRAGPDTILAGSTQPGGTAERVPSGWRVNGRWPFASGCRHAAWMGAFCVMTEDGKPLPGPAGDGGPPMVHAVFLPARDWQVEDTWHAAGLRGTGSHHITLRDAIVPAARIVDPASGAPGQPGPLYQAVPYVLPLLHGAVSVGMAEGAVNELVALADTGRQQFRAPAPMRDSEIFQYELGRVAADVRAARAFLQVQAASHWRHALAGTLKDDARLAEGTQAAIWLATTCTRIADACFTLGGGSAVYDSSPLQQRLRDLHAAAQHAVAQQRHYVTSGKLMLRAAR